MKTISFARTKRTGSIAGRLYASLFVMLVLVAGSRARAQALPTAEASPISTGFSIPSFGGSLNWAVTGSGTLDFGYYNKSGVAPGAAISGDVAYLSESKFRPFSMVLSAGKSWGWSGQPSYGYASLGLSQLVNVGRWNFTFSDSVSYLPSTATPGLSGVAGVGDLGVPPVQTGPDAGQGILTNYSPLVTNSGGASVQRQITGKTSLNASGSYSILRFVDGPGSAGSYGLEDDAITGSAGFAHRLDARTSFGGNYAYSSFIYLNNAGVGFPAPNFVSQTASFTLSHQVNRKLNLSIAAGPQWTQINLAQNSVTLNAYADASLTYTTEFVHLGASYVRSTNSGYGVVAGSLADSVSLSASRLVSRVWNATADVAWSHTSGLPTPGTTPYNFTTLIAGVQVSRALARSLSCYGSYTFETQSHASSANTVDLFNGNNNIIGFGITYSPVARRFARP